MAKNVARIVFLVSLPRSGSTLLQAILGTHSNIYTLSEPWIALGPLSLWRKRAGEFDFNLELSQRAQRAFFSAANFSEEELQSAIRTYLMTFYQKALERSGKSIFLDKTPRYYEILPELHATFPKARFILLHRNPLDVLVSILQTWVRDNHKQLLFYQRDLQAAIPKIIEFQERNHPNVTTISFEELLEHPEARVAELCEFVGVDFEPGMLNYNSEVKWEFGDKKFKHFETVSQIRQQPDLRTLSAAHQQFLKCYVSDLAPDECSSFGYQHEMLSQRVGELSTDPDAEEFWNMAMQIQLFRDFTTARFLFHKQIQEMKERKTGWRKYFSWVK